MKNKNVDFSMFLYLLFSCVLLMVGIAILASFIAPIIFFFRNGVFDYRLDTFIFFVKLGSELVFHWVLVFGCLRK